MNPRHVRCLLLDIGNVLVGLNFNLLAGRVRALTGLETPQLQAALTADHLVKRFESGQITEADFYEEVCRRIGVRIPLEVFYETWNSIFEQPLIPDELLASLARKVRLWAISNTNKTHFEFMLRRFAFLSHFEGFALSYQVGALKPDARIFIHALEKAQFPAEEALFVDDQDINVKAALSLGIDAFRFLNPDQFAAELKTRGL